jgi:hypothetical protein
MATLQMGGNGDGVVDFKAAALLLPTAVLLFLADGGERAEEKANEWVRAAAAAGWLGLKAPFAPLRNS